MKDTPSTDYMGRALSLAHLALGCTSPNPAVGAVLVKEGEIVGEGYTQPPGFGHAEVVALQEAGGNARGATMYVTLEPCCHFGRTPPCTQALLQAGIAEVHMAMLDPNPLVSGKGKSELEKAGVKIFLGERQEEAQLVNEAYIKHITTGYPFVIAKFAMSLDGKIATKTGDSRWISNEESRGIVHRLRQRMDAIMVGVNTVLRDNPRLTSRACGGKGGTVKIQPLRVIVDSWGRTPVSARVFRQTGKTLLATAHPLSSDRAQALSQGKVEVLEVPQEAGEVDLKELLRLLGQRGITSVLVEGGGTLLGALFEKGLVDKVTAFIAPIIIGGKDAGTPVEGTGVSKVAEALRLGKVKVERVGDDVMVCGYVEGDEGCSRA